jgi:predicted membrane channel-forming protein YqfA (hemolysin III family)
MNELKLSFFVTGALAVVSYLYSLFFGLNGVQFLTVWVLASLTYLVGVHLFPVSPIQNFEEL